MIISIPSYRGNWSWPYLLARLALGLVFAYAGAVKLWDVHSFGVTIARYNLVPEPLLLPAAVGLPLLEVLAGLGLIWEVRGSLTVISAMLLMFAGVLWFGVLSGLEIDCGCFAPAELAEHDGLRQALYRDLGLMVVAAYLYLWRWRRAAGSRPGSWRFSWTERNQREEISG